MRPLILRALTMLLMAAGPALGDAGHDLFTGQAQSADGAAVVRFACHNCHGRDGQGGLEGDVPDIAGDALRAPTDLRPAYDPEGFRRALREGVDPTGRVLSRIMPRYDLTPDQMALLWDYLADLPRRQSLGLGPTTIRLGIIADPRQPDRTDAYIRQFHAAMAEALPDRTAYGRRVELIALPDPLPHADQVLALLAAPPGRKELVAQLTATGLPVIFPLTGLSGAEDATVQRAFTPCARDVNLAIARQLATGAARGIALSTDPERANELTYFIKLEAPETQIWRSVPGEAPPMPPNSFVDLDGQLGEVPLQGAALYQLASTVRSLSAHPDAGAHILIDDAPALLDLVIGQGLSPSEAHARLSARILSEALLQAGRDLSRDRLMTALDQADLGPLGLDYDSYPLCGTGEVGFRPVPSGSRD